MSAKLEGIKSEALQPIAIVSCEINSLPRELLENIFSRLSRHDLQGTVRVNRWIGSVVKGMANFNEPASIKYFIQILIQKLNAGIYQGQREMLVGISKNITSQNFANLCLLKEYILDVKAQLIHVIKTLDRATINDLRDNLPPPHFFEDIFGLAGFEKQIDEANLIINVDAREAALLNICQALTQAGKIDKAIAITTLISCSYRRFDGLMVISQALAQAGNTDRAIAIATSISHKDEREKVLGGISQTLAQAGNIDRAIAIAASISSEVGRGYALRGISQTLAQAGNIDRAIAIAASISHKNEEARARNERERALGGILKL